MNLTLKIWRQKNASDKGKMVDYKISDVSPDMSFLEMLDVLNTQLIESGDEPVAFDHDCREGICGMCSLYINGELDNTITNATGTGLSTTIGTAFSEFAIGKDGAEFGTRFFNGDIDEVRVFDVALTEDQLREMVHQEIEQNGSNVRGKVIPKDIEDFTDTKFKDFNNLQLENFYHAALLIVSNNYEMQLKDVQFQSAI